MLVGMALRRQRFKQVSAFFDSTVMAARLKEWRTGMAVADTGQKFWGTCRPPSLAVPRGGG